MVGVAQSIRAPGCGPGGRGFDSHRSPHKKRTVKTCFLTVPFIFACVCSAILVLFFNRNDALLLPFVIVVLLTKNVSPQVYLTMRGDEKRMYLQDLIFGILLLVLLLAGEEEIG